MSLTIIPEIEHVIFQREICVPEEDIIEDFLREIVPFIGSHRVVARNIIIRDLSAVTKIDGLIDPSISDRDIKIWRWCAFAFLEYNDLISAEKVIEECYLRMLELQLENNIRFHKSISLHTRGEILIRFGQHQRAKKYVILAHIEDIINGTYDEPAGQTLKLAGISDRDLELILKEANEHIFQNEGSPILFPEEIYQKIQYQIEYGSIGELSKLSVFTNPIYLQVLWDRVVQTSETDNTDLKRRTLESLAQYLFSSVEGLYAKPSQRTGPYELDGIVTNISTHPFLRRLDTYIPIECKNWKSAIGAPEISHFIGKLSLFQCNYGILLSKNGIKELTVNELRKDAARRSNIFVFVFSEEDIKAIIEGNDIITLLIEKYEELKFSIKM